MYNTGRIVAIWHCFAIFQTSVCLCSCSSFDPGLSPVSSTKKKACKIRDHSVGLQFSFHLIVLCSLQQISTCANFAVCALHWRNLLFILAHFRHKTARWWISSQRGRRETSRLGRHLALANFSPHPVCCLTLALVLIATRPVQTSSWMGTWGNCGQQTLKRSQLCWQFLLPHCA